MDVAIRIDSETSDGKRNVFWNEELSHHIRENELQDTLQEARTNLWKSSQPNGVTLGSRLYRMVNGSGGQLDAALRESRNQGVALHISLDIPFEIDALPFELLRNEEKFLLLDTETHLNRKITDRNWLKVKNPEERALKLLFMACSPVDLKPKETLQFEKEEEQILQAVERFPVDVRIEDSGSLSGLRDMLYEAAGYDIVHISGHADVDYKLGPVFYMENDIGELEKITPSVLWENLKDFPPRLLFLSGCSTGKSDKVNASESFAHSMVERGISVVLGWGLPVSDIGAMTFAAELYEYLSMGKDIPEAIQRARQGAQDSYHPWPLLRLFTDGSKLVPLIAPGQSLRAKTVRQTAHKYLSDSQVKVLGNGFVGRRREIQNGVRTLKGFGDKYGLLIRGPAGVGKSCLAGKLIERFPEKELIAIHGVLSKVEVLQKLRNSFDRKGVGSGLEVIQSDREYDEKIKELFRSAFKEQPMLLLFDDFEQNLIRHGDEYYATPECIEIIKPFLSALEWSEGQTNLIITSRYPFILEVEGKNVAFEMLEDVTLTSFRGSDLEKKKGELKYISTSAHASLFIESSKGNPRLLEWLEQIAEEEDKYDLDDLRQVLQDKLEEFNREYFPDLTAKTEFEILEEKEREARHLLLRGNYLEARKVFAVIIRDYPAYKDQLRTEFGFIFDFDADERTEQESWERKRAQLEWRCKVWAVLSQDEEDYRLQFDPQDKSDKQEPVDSIPKYEDIEDVSPSKKISLSPEAKGEALERATLNLLRLLFRFEEGDEERIVDELSQQLRGTQLGFDIKAAYCQAKENSHVRCLIECKSQEKAITSDDIGGKLHEAEAFHSDIDHWILIAPRAGISNTLRSLLDRWEDEGRYPFRVHVWTKDTEVSQFFGLAPSLYDTWCDHLKDQEHPSEWSLEKKKKILHHWREKLVPPLRLPKGWNDYVREPRHLRIFSDESQDVLDRLAVSHIEPRGVDETGAPFLETLSYTVQKWLESPKKSLLLLGDFGDGKSIFTYLFSLKLFDAFRRNLREGWIPMRFSLRDFSRPQIHGGREFLRRRLEEFGADVGSWNDMVAEYKVLVILDGVDEMTKTLDSQSVNETIDKLMDCFSQEFRGQKILVTCRTPFFEGLTDREYLLESFDNPLIVYLRNFDRSVVSKQLASQATTPERKRRLQSLRSMHDPIGLATKPLFFQMITETLWDSETELTSEAELYEEYVRKCLERKSEYLESDNSRILKKQLIKNMIEILEIIALEIHRGNKEYACLRDLAKATDKTAYAKLLWDSANASEPDEQDARSRVGVRSLLRSVEISDKEGGQDAWPVDFCHRSIREYFVARKIESLVRESVSQAREILTQNDLSYEIIYFVAALMRKNGTTGDYHAALRSLAEASRSIDGNDQLSLEEKRRLGRNAVMLLYRSEGQLHEADWRNMSLDGADLSGADLTGKDFSGTSLRNATLDNAIFIDANFTHTDLTGVRLEETAEVRSLCVPRGMSGFFASYRDGQVRWWSSAPSPGFHSQVTFETSSKPGSRLYIAALPGADLCVYGGNEVIFADYTGKDHQQVAAFKTKGRLSRVIFKENYVFAVEEVSSNKYLARLFTFQGEGETHSRTRTLGSSWLCDTLGKKAIVKAETGKGLAIVSWRTEKEFEFTIGNAADASSLAVQGPINDDGNTYLIACGEHSGMVRVWECQFAEEQPTVREIVAKRLHDGIVSAIAFVEDHSILTGGNDKKIYHLDLGSEEKEPSVLRSFELKLQCEGMKIENLNSEKERSLLQQLIDP